MQFAKALGLWLKRSVFRSSNEELLKQFVIADISADLSQREERHQHDEHDRPDDKNLLQAASA